MGKAEMSVEIPFRIDNDLCDADKLAEGAMVIYGGAAAQVTAAEYVEVDEEQMVKVFLIYRGYAVGGEGRHDVIVVPKDHTFHTLQVVVDKEWL